MTVLLLTRDISVISQVDGAAARSGVAVQTVSSEDDALAQCVEGHVELVILDLGAPSLNVKSLVERVKEVAVAAPRIVAFGSHVHVEKLTAAREAGCDDVISRGQFFGQLDTVIRGV
jgi:DNA-binding response OmpR family regulator